MRLEPLIHSPRPGEKPPQAFAFIRFQLDQGPQAGAEFVAALDACRNPCCPCGCLGCACRRVADPEFTRVFDLDAIERRFEPRKARSRESISFGRAFAAELTAVQWTWLYDRLRSYKQFLTERADLDTLRFELPDEVRSGKSSLLAYGDVFPWAAPLTCQCGQAAWIADDEYCIRPGCTCTEAVLSFLLLPPVAGALERPVRPNLIVRFDYERGTYETLERSPSAPGAPDLVGALRASHPGLQDTLRRRRGQLQRLGRRLRAAPAPPPPPPAKVGRNDPCPCGSGKKFKKCCGTNANL